MLLSPQALLMAYVLYVTISLSFRMYIKFVPHSWCTVELCHTSCLSQITLSYCHGTTIVNTSILFSLRCQGCHHIINLNWLKSAEPSGKVLKCLVYSLTPCCLADAMMVHHCWHIPLMNIHLRLESHCTIYSRARRHLLFAQDLLIHVIIWERKYYFAVLAS